MDLKTSIQSGLVSNGIREFKINKAVTDFYAMY